MLNMVIPEELSDNQEYWYICEDIKEESVNYGEVLTQMINGANGVGRVYMKFVDPQVAQVALKALAGRSFWVGVSSQHC